MAKDGCAYFRRPAIHLSPSQDCRRLDFADTVSAPVFRRSRLSGDGDRVKPSGLYHRARLAGAGCRCDDSYHSLTQTLARSASRLGDHFAFREAVPALFQAQKRAIRRNNGKHQLACSAPMKTAVTTVARYGNPIALRNAYVRRRRCGRDLKARSAKKFATMSKRTTAQKNVTGTEYISPSMRSQFIAGG